MTVPGYKIDLLLREYVCVLEANTLCAYFIDTYTRSLETLESRDCNSVNCSKSYAGEGKLPFVVIFYANLCDNASNVLLVLLKN